MIDPTIPERLGSYSEALSFLGRMTDYEKQARFGTGYRKLGLEPVRRLLGSVGDPQEKFPSIHVAGTKGKGSTCLALERILRDLGLRVGTYLSPHLEDLRERVRIDGTLISEQEFTRSLEPFVTPAEALFEEDPGNHPSFFDLLTASALLAFHRGNVDVAIMETGLGGRLDSTNVVSPRVTIITHIGLDHVETLGPDLASIAAEKAGILKAGVPLVCGVEVGSIPGSVIRERARELQVEVIGVGEEILVRELSSSVFAVKTPRRDYSNLSLSVLGAVQRGNAALAIAAVELFLESGTAEPRASEGDLPGRVRDSLARLRLPGRAELIGSRPRILLDGAHNPDSALALSEVIAGEIDPSGPVTLLFSMNRRESPGEVLDSLLPRVDRVVLSRVPSPRSEDPVILRAYILSRRPELPVAVEEDPGKALDLALEDPDEPGLVVIAGSFWSAGDFRRRLRRRGLLEGAPSLGARDSES